MRTILAGCAPAHTRFTHLVRSVDPRSLRVSSDVSRRKAAHAYHQPIF
ncbi:hypothetical protein Strvi_2966 [Streptomyces violaceusniger Tu 4113]|uniref:Uncharacterized protein n=1 Tax=Streptomyces violaceusniger (strain Tu 4113) TaxID=653045 RepID=G2PDR3_STRV4|nr:hypothetical protein Strvi_2966 [Streptomyces violaceusniger Tu 4113]